MLLRALPWHGWPTRLYLIIYASTLKIRKRRRLQAAPRAVDDVDRREPVGPRDAARREARVRVGERRVHEEALAAGHRARRVRRARAVAERDRRVEDVGRRGRPQRRRVAARRRVAGRVRSQLRERHRVRAVRDEREDHGAPRVEEDVAEGPLRVAARAVVAVARAVGEIQVAPEVGVVHVARRRQILPRPLPVAAPLRRAEERRVRFQHVRAERRVGRRRKIQRQRGGVRPRQRVLRAREVRVPKDPGRRRGSAAV
mmetsp:Transcript_32364/g.99757  ORF Transcript_32364/g.99757 Transcript_32364/m.99757 type:complete len:257 (+) Transcript_32364:198-968(+)